LILMDILIVSGKPALLEVLDPEQNHTFNVSYIVPLLAP
jgi:ATP-dependent Lon protease